MTQTQLALERIITKVFNHYSVSLDITDKIRATFKTKLWRMGRKLSKTGGKQRKELLHRWEEGEESLWNFTVDESEATSQMMARKRKVENQLHQERVKRQKLEEKVKDLKQKAEKQSAVISELNFKKKAI